MIDLDPEWFSHPVTSRNVFNEMLRSLRLQFEGYDGSSCIIRSIDPDYRLSDRDQDGLRRLIPLFIKAAIELGDEPKHHTDFILIDL